MKRTAWRFSMKNPQAEILGSDAKVTLEGIELSVKTPSATTKTAIAPSTAPRWSNSAKSARCGRVTVTLRAAAAGAQSHGRLVRLEC